MTNDKVNCKGPIGIQLAKQLQQLETWHRVMGCIHFSREEEERNCVLSRVERGKSEEYWTHSLGKELISSDTGLDQIIKNLDNINLGDDAQVTYRFYSKFLKFVRPYNMTLQSYISDFDKMVADLKQWRIYWGCGGAHTPGTKQYPPWEFQHPLRFFASPKKWGNNQYF